jgi:ATP/maltotriose-dependent transcriptional regulator MalT
LLSLASVIVASTALVSILNWSPLFALIAVTATLWAYFGYRGFEIAAERRRRERKQAGTEGTGEVTIQFESGLRVTGPRETLAGDHVVVVEGTTEKVLAEVGGRPIGIADDLTPRQNEILGLVAEGVTTADIAARLALSEATVRTHIAAITAKLRAAQPPR